MTDREAASLFEKRGYEVYRCEVVDGVVSAELSLSSNWFDHEEVEKLFGLPHGAITVDYLGDGCDTCGWGTTVHVSFLLP